MAAPMKPWELAPACSRPPNVNNRMAPPEDVGAATSTVPHFQSTLGGATAESAIPGNAPPVPERPMAGYSYSSPYSALQTMSPYGGGYGGHVGGYGGAYGGAFGSGFGNYGAYGGAGSSYYGRPAGLGAGPESWFIQAAEEGSRSTFESIESFVSVFTSISQMMESTYMLVHSSFRTVVGVAEQMGRMRLHLAQVLSTLSLVRTVRWIVNFLRRWLGYPALAGAEQVWSEVARPTAAGEPSAPAAPRWPVLMYLAAVLGAPYLIYRLLRTNTSQQDTESWRSGGGEHFSAVCVYDFSGASGGELTVRAGQQLRLAPRRLQPRMRGWVLASDGAAVGLVPAAYVKIRGLVPAGGVAVPGPSQAAEQAEQAAEQAEQAQAAVGQAQPELGHDRATAEAAASSCRSSTKSRAVAAGPELPPQTQATATVGQAGGGGDASKSAGEVPESAGQPRRSVVTVQESAGGGGGAAKQPTESQRSGTQPLAESAAAAPQPSEDGCCGRLLTSGRPAAAPRASHSTAHPGWASQ